MNNNKQIGETNRERVGRFIEAGVLMEDPSSVYISEETVIASGTTLLPGVLLRGKTIIGAGCTIGPNTQIDSCTVGNNTTVNASQLYESRIGNDVNIGPFAHIRPNCNVGDRVRIGNFVEIKNSNIGSDTNICHLTYVGDSDVGSRVNFGCGTVTVNYDGTKKHRTKIADHVFIGCNSNLIAPVELCEHAYIAAGSTITDTVPEASLAIARARQVNKKDWTRHKGKDTSSKK